MVAFRSGCTEHGKGDVFYSFLQRLVLSVPRRAWLWIAGSGMWDCVFRIWTLAPGARGLGGSEALRCQLHSLAGRDAGGGVAGRLLGCLDDECICLGRWLVFSTGIKISFAQGKSICTQMSRTYPWVILYFFVREMVCVLKSLVLRCWRWGLWASACKPIWGRTCPVSPWLGSPTTPPSALNRILAHPALHDALIVEFFPTASWVIICTSGSW